MTEEKGARLQKAAKELNISIDTIVEFLAGKGIDCPRQPNTKLDGAAYELLLNNFSQDKQAKDKSKALSINREKHVTISIDDAARERRETAEEQEEGVLIKNVVAAPEVKETPAEPPAPPAKPKVAPPEPEAPKERTGPVILGKIELAKPKPPKPKEKPVEKAPAPKVEVKAPEKIEPVAPPAAPVEKPVKPEPVEEKPERIETRVQKLEGPKITGKLDLTQFERKKTPVASSNEDKQTEKNRKKRRRISPAEAAAGANRPPQRGKGRQPVTEADKEISQEDIQREIKETLARLSLSTKSKSSKYRKAKRDDVRSTQEEEQAREEEEKSVLKVTEFLTANDLATLMSVSVTQVISACMSLGYMVSINQRLDAETIAIVAEDFGYKVEFTSSDVDDNSLIEADVTDRIKERSPIVTVMGHVDHGKTSLLDYIRKSNVIAGEAGGITQHIGAYNVTLDNGKQITFLDTPGHEAFTAMRARGAKLTDVAIIVISADDNVMPQTKEAINHAQAAGVPMVFAINKIDKAGANPDKIREELAAMNLLVEDWGGKYQCQEISAKAGTNIETLLEKVLLEAELLELKADPDKRAHGTVIEAALDKGKGFVTTVVVQSGTLRIGDVILSGSHSGRVKAMFNERGQSAKEAGPSVPVTILGLSGAPSAGDKFNVMEDEREARDIATKRQQLLREQGVRTKKHITLDEIGRRIALGDFQELNIIIKGDVDGSIEALSDSLLNLSTEKIQVNVIHKSVGQISENDVMLASASNAIIVGFQVRPSASARVLAEREDIDIRLYSIIYKAIEEIKLAMEGMLKPKVEEKVVCNIEIRETFKISKVGTIAGCYVTDGTIHRNTRVRVIRDGVVVYTGELGSLKRFKDDVKEVKKGFECGLNIANFNDIKVGDNIEGYEEVEVKQTL
jgi:translation initiation factor IF-2